MEISPTAWQVISNLLVFGGICTAVLTIRFNVKMARKTQTATFLFESRKDSEYIDGLHTLRRVRDSGKSFRSYVFPVAENLSKVAYPKLNKKVFELVLDTEKKELDLPYISNH